MPNDLVALANANAFVFVLGGLVIALVLLYYLTPNLEAVFLRPAARGALTLQARLWRQVRLLQSSSEPFGGRVRELLYRDGDSVGPMLTTSDFFLLVRVATGAVFGVVGLVLAIFLGIPVFILILPLLGYFGPSFYASRHNQARRKKMESELPLVLQRLETRIAAGVELPEALAKIAARHKGPLFTELLWASRQMSLPGINQYEVLRDIDRRNGLFFFETLAYQAERAERRSRRDAVEVILSLIERLLIDADIQRQAKIGGLANKLVLSMIVFLFLGLALSVGGSYLAAALN